MRPGLIRANDREQDARTLYFIAEHQPTRCFLVCAHSGEHACSLIRDEFPDFVTWECRKIRLQRGLKDALGVLEVFELDEAHWSKNQNPAAQAAAANNS